ncbi:MAG TPA: NaeI family type II restriction endonuclease [Aestuariivirga sp.]
MARNVKILRNFPPSIGVGHIDYELLSRLQTSVLKSAGGEKKLADTLPTLLQDAIDFVLDPVRTARNSISDLDNVEKTFIGLKVEHFLRDFLDVPKGLRDLIIDGVDVDVKNTVGRTWTIPPETYRSEEPCLLIALADGEKRFWLGLIVARDAYLGAKEGNRDGKRAITSMGMKHILWLVEGKALPPSRWNGIDLGRFRDLRKVKGGTKRTAMFFSENVGKPMHRIILQTLLFDQRDYMKRLRGNGGARDELREQSLELLSSKYDRKKLMAAGYKIESPEYFLAVRKN